MSKSPQKFIEELQKSRPLKVWSLIITFFGDAVEPRGGIVAASTLQSVMQVMGVGSGAVRTACSRLARDGWIERQKQGRNSFYRLSDMGHTPFRNASRQIYATPPTAAPTSNPNKTGLSQPSLSSNKYTLLIQNPQNTSSSHWQSMLVSGIRINGNCVLFASADPRLRGLLANMQEFEDTLVLTDASARLPDWIRRIVCTDESAHRYHQLMQRFALITQNPPTDPLTSLAIRCLLIHEWRRLLLRSTPVPIELIPANWPHNDCHSFVASLYRQLFGSGEQWMDENALGPDGPLKVTDQKSKIRFSSHSNCSA